MAFVRSVYVLLSYNRKTKQKEMIDVFSNKLKVWEILARWHNIALSNEPGIITHPNCGTYKTFLKYCAFGNPTYLELARGNERLTVIIYRQSVI